ncbi:MAG: M15 family metallopeptidase, partial [Promicromonosporaceae bacterium]|nr:M15 family metallopeptidase [Promicromonosporaceae bacterium]
QSWGYSNKRIVGRPTLSNHASGTAIDLNASLHPAGQSNTFSPEQQREIRAILDDLNGVIRWGADYSRYSDEMHFEINAGASSVAQTAEQIRELPDYVPLGSNGDPIP